MEKEFTDWFKANEKRFAHAQFDEKQIAYAAWLEGKNEVFRNHDVSGNEVALTFEQRQCPSCKLNIQLEDKYCSHCGLKFKRQ